MGVKAIKNLTKLPVWCIGPLLPQCMLKKSEKDSIFESRSGKDSIFEPRSGKDSILEPKSGKDSIFDPRSGKDSIFESKKGKDSIFESKKGKDSIFESRLGKEHGLSSEECISWLNEHPERSVLYISFGSQNTIGTSQMMALAMGLEESERPFIWVIRPPIGFDIKVLESLSQGMPIISWPLAAEQTFNSKMLMEEMGVCVELTKWYSSDVDKEDVKEVVEIVLGENGKGKEMKEKAIELGMCIRDAVKEEEDFKGSSVKALDDFISTLLCRRNMSS
ncbi:hypothetical protein KY285_026420 [Solanum tuberosum]|nr:hypothetical protein KY285_026420 [Solanum tuberosum]